MSHGNARTTFQGRLLIVQRHQQGWRQAHGAAAMGCVWEVCEDLARAVRRRRRPGLVTPSSRPHSTTARTSTDLESQVVAVRRQQRCGREEISVRTGVPARGDPSDLHQQRPAPLHLRPGSSATTLNVATAHPEDIRRLAGCEGAAGGGGPGDRLRESLMGGAGADVFGARRLGSTAVPGRFGAPYAGCPSGAETPRRQPASCPVRAGFSRSAEGHEREAARRQRTSARRSDAVGEPEGAAPGQDGQAE